MALLLLIGIVNLRDWRHRESGPFGGLLALRFEPRPPAKRPAAPAAASASAPLPGIMRHFAEQLELTPEQREKIRPMVERAEEDIRRLRQTGLRETGIILKRLQEDFATELTPDQRKKMEKMQEKMQERLRDDRGAFQPLREKFNGKRPGLLKDAAAKEEPAAPAKTDAPAPGK